MVHQTVLNTGPFQVIALQELNDNYQIHWGRGGEGRGRGVQKKMKHRDTKVVRKINDFFVFGRMLWGFFSLTSQEKCIYSVYYILL